MLAELGAMLEPFESGAGWLVGGADFAVSTWIFLRLLGLVYLVAFVSFWVQAAGLVGSRGILPIGETMGRVREARGGRRLRRFLRFPTVFWWRSDDAALSAVCATGTVLSVLLVVGFAPIPCLLALWVLYLSICVVGRDFLSFQWDVLLLETGLLAILVAPWHLVPSLARPDHPSTLGLLLLWWLLFRLMFESGVVKLTSGDQTWRDLTALDYHYFTQPLPTPLAWYAHHLPSRFQRLSVLVMYVAEIALPLLIFAPRPLRLAACAGIVVFQLLVFATGNYNFFNLLAIALCVLLVDDGIWEAVLPPGWVERFATGEEPALVAVLLGLAVLVVTLVVTPLQLYRSLRPRASGPRLARRLERTLAPFRSLNSYGLFRVMTTRRPEIVVEGSRDGETWEPYEFRYKPGDPERPPPFVEPHQPRLDWQMWFAALGSYAENPWFRAFIERLLSASGPVLDLLEEDPFDGGRPQRVRAVLYEYRFTTPEERRETGNWWSRERLGPYSPTLGESDHRGELRG